MINFIRDQLSDEELLAQLSEECNELAKAALKMRRVLDGRNPTPATMPEAWENLQEEISDVLLCLLVLEIDYNDPEYGVQMQAKLDRWVGRLQQHQRAPWEDKTESGLLED
jgi:NTP pyrophosphatase (non-canonical NTP hydrolase)